MTKKIHLGLKKKCVEFYDSRKGDKVYFATFYSRVRLNPEGDMEELIKRKARGGWKRDNIPFTGVHAEEMKRWFNQVEPKASKQTFYGRVRLGYSKEQAILTGDKWLAVKGTRPAKDKSKKQVLSKQEKLLQEAQKEEDYTGIDITLSKEEAQVFREEYMRIIINLERELMQLEEKTLIKETNEKLDLVRAELNVFNSYNKL